MAPASVLSELSETAAAASAGPTATASSQQEHRDRFRRSRWDRGRRPSFRPVEASKPIQTATPPLAVASTESTEAQTSPVGEEAAVLSLSPASAQSIAESPSDGGPTGHATVITETAKPEDRPVETIVATEKPVPAQEGIEVRKSPVRRDRGSRYSRPRTSQRATPPSPSKLEEPKLDSLPSNVEFTEIEKPVEANIAAPPLRVDKPVPVAPLSITSSSGDRSRKPAPKAGSSTRRPSNLRGPRPRPKKS